MKSFLPTSAIAFSLMVVTTLVAFKKSPNESNTVAVAAPAASPKIQAAILLDVSGSMNGLIEQAKAQLWNMVSTMGKAQCNGISPQIEIALYEYGRPANGAKTGYVKQINSFTGDLDSLSQNLFNLTIDGGDEYCGHVIFSSLNELNWDSNPANYKVIFIAGNEDFLQGDVHYTRACDEAKKKGVIVNTIYCGDKMQGIREHWNLNSECGSGSFTNINQNAQIDDIPTPYDSLLYTLNDQLNGTYLAYGYAGASKYRKQTEVDKKNYHMNKSVAMKRISVKANGALYQNSSWDLVDAGTKDKEMIEKLDFKTLPDSLQHKTPAEIKVLVERKAAERKTTQQEIAVVNAKRETFIAAQKAREANDNKTATLETEVEKIIKSQARRYNMIIQ